MNATASSQTCEGRASDLVFTVRGRRLESYEPGLVGRHSCPVCGNPGIPVSRLVMRAMLPGDLQADFARDGFSFCSTPSCPLAYFDNEGPAYVHKDELRVVVGVKFAGPASTVCYCLRVTEGRIMEEVAIKRCCRTLDQVAETTGALLGKACHIVNPSGQCCGTEVKGAILNAMYLAGFTKDTPEVQRLMSENVDHCRSRFGLGTVASRES